MGSSNAGQHTTSIHPTFLQNIKVFYDLLTNGRPISYNAIKGRVLELAYESRQGDKAHPAMSTALRMGAIMRRMGTEASRHGTFLFHHYRSTRDYQGFRGIVVSPV